MNNIKEMLKTVYTKNINIVVFSDVTPFSPVDTHQRLKEITASDRCCKNQETVK